LYTQYQGIEPDTRKKDRALWEIAQMQKQSGDVLGMIDTLDRWRRLYGKSADNTDDYVQSFYDEAKLYARKGNRTQQAAIGPDVVKAYKTVGSPPKGKAAKMAAEYHLAALEADYAKRWEPYEIKTAAATKQQAQNQNDAIVKLRNDFETRYKELEA